MFRRRGSVDSSPLAIPETAAASLLDSVLAECAREMTVEFIPC
jgi:hypothetical protein